MAKCTAITKNGRIQLIIQQGEDGYKEFADILNEVEKNGYLIWYGDVEDGQGEERGGLIITSLPEPHAK